MAAFTASGSGKLNVIANILSQGVVLTLQPVVSQAFTASPSTGTFFISTFLPAKNTLTPKIPTYTVYPRTQ